MDTTTKTPKAVNYTVEQTAKMIQDYLAGITVEAIATELGKTARSVTMKLVREKVYTKKEYKTKTGELVTHKAELADAIGKVLNMSESDTTSLESCNKNALQVIFTALANSKPLVE